MKWRNAAARALAALAIGVYFFRLVRPALHAAFSPDDTMNLYRAWSFPLGALVKANLLFFQNSVFYRPIGAAWYRAIYHFAGFHPAAFHIADLLFLAANTFLAYAVARRLSDSRETGMLAALLGCYHTKFAGLYFDTGYIYDVLCCFFYFAAFLVYLRIRQSGRTLSLPALAVCCALLICALNAKEMAVTLPLMLAAYEFLYRPKPADRRSILVTAAIVILFALGRALGPDSLVHNAAYGPVFTAQRLMESTTGFLRELFLTPVSALAAVILWIAMLAAAWFTRSNALRFAWLYLTIAPLPVAFVLPRGASQYYLVLFGWALYAAAALVEIARRAAPKLPSRVRAPILFIALIALLYPYYKRETWSSVAVFRPGDDLVTSVAGQLRALHPTLPRAARLYFLDDPIDARIEDLVFIVRLEYRDPSIVVDRFKRAHSRPTDTALAAYDHVFDLRGGRFVEPALPSPVHFAPALRPEFYHADWSPVDAAHPARPGEIVIAKAAGLGPTSPETPPDQPFPRDPLAAVLARLQVTVNGRPAEVVTALGWPGEVNLYRLDFRVPAGKPPGPATVRVEVKGIAGPPASLVCD